MEPMNCTADVQRGRLRRLGADAGADRVAPGGDRGVSGLPADKVKIHTTYLGGGFGRRGEADFVTDAVETSKAVGKPVKVVWTREDDMQHDFYRPVTYVRMWGAVDAAGKPTVFMQRIVQQSLMKRIGALPPNGVDFISVDGRRRCRTTSRTSGSSTPRHDPGIPFGFWRSVGASVPGLRRRGVHRRAGDGGRRRIRIEFRRDLLEQGIRATGGARAGRPRRPAGASRCRRAVRAASR